MPTHVISHEEIHQLLTPSTISHFWISMLWQEWHAPLSVHAIPTGRWCAQQKQNRTTQIAYSLLEQNTVLKNNQLPN
jgi:hypothetical protein